MAADLSHPFESLILDAVRGLDLGAADPVSPELSRLCGAAATAGSVRAPLCELAAKIREADVPKAVEGHLAAAAELKAARARLRSAAKEAGAAWSDEDLLRIEEGRLDVEEAHPDLGPFAGDLRIAAAKAKDSERARLLADLDGEPDAFAVEVRRVSASSALSDWAWFETGWMASLDRRTDVEGRDWLLVRSLRPPAGCPDDSEPAAGAWLRLAHYALEIGCDGVAHPEPFDAKPAGRAATADSWSWDRPTRQLVGRSGRKEIARFAEVDEEELPAFLPRNAAATLAASDARAPAVRLPSPKRVLDTRSCELFGRLLPAMASALAESCGGDWIPLLLPKAHPDRRRAAGAALTAEALRAAAGKGHMAGLEAAAEALARRLESGVEPSEALEDSESAEAAERIGARVEAEDLHARGLWFRDAAFEDWTALGAACGGLLLTPSAEDSGDALAKAAAARMAHAFSKIEPAHVSGGLMADLALVALHAPAKIAFDAARRVWAALDAMDLIPPFERAVLRSAEASFKKIAKEEGFEGAQGAEREGIVFASMVAGVLAEGSGGEDDPERRPPVEALRMMGAASAAAKGLRHDLSKLGLLGSRDVFRALSGSQVGRLGAPPPKVRTDKDEQDKEKRRKERERERRKAKESLDLLSGPDCAMDPSSMAFQVALLDLLRGLDAQEKAALLTPLLSGADGRTWHAVVRVAGSDSETMRIVAGLVGPVAARRLEDALADYGHAERRTRRIGV